MTTFDRIMDRIKRQPTATMVGVLCGLSLMFVIQGITTSVPIKTEDEAALSPPRRLNEPKIKVFAGDLISDKERRDLQASDILELTSLTTEQQAEFLKSHFCVENAETKFEQLMTQRPHLAQELWKYCALYQFGGVYLDAESPLLVSLETLLSEYPGKNIAVLSDPKFPKSVHGSLLVLREPQSPVARGMLDLIMRTPVDTLDSSPLLIPKALYELISAREQGNKPLVSGTNWLLLDQKCSVDPLSHTNDSTTHHCPKESGYCCHVQNGKMGVVLMTRHPLLPYQVLPDPSTLPKPLKNPNFDENELPFISTLQERVLPPPETTKLTPNFFDILAQNQCLPSSKQCSTCLREKKGATCKTCRKVCGCYCKALCHTDVKPKHVSKEVTVTPPLYARDPNRIIPRIIHQTWFEVVNKTSYPNMSRLMESWRRSGWEYKFYTDAESRVFLQKHFPVEVVQAYDALLPGAFRADLFRYCVLLIHGGVYADMDVMLEANLDSAVGPDVGFMVPTDEPGKQMDKRMCLWNGFIAAAPGHPYLAKVIETVVNSIRNRFTSVDVDQTFCPDPELSVLHAFDTLFTAGPCILGGTVNKVLGRHGQTQYEPGELNPWSESAAKASEQGTSFVRGLQEQPNLRIPGRTVILKQNKWDMGAHRFTLLEQNLVVAATDMPDYDDRENLDGDHEIEHYSKTHVKVGIYGLEKLYANKRKANEDIRILVNGQGNQYKK